MQMRILASILLVLVAPATGASNARAGLMGVMKVKAARNLAVAGVPDPTCKTGVISVPDGTNPQICCAGYCGECSNYPTCKSVRGQNSTYACCQDEVAGMECGKGAAANVCLKKCSESIPPCIMETTTYTPPDPSQETAGDDCNKAVSDWTAKAGNAMSR
mmetsp:Transcript_78233/g.135702  ORF Transcript_78233/g.135702 Transcript_78233/m.135702 type:complete len:160 (-) Transcript_78233:39-518(-)